MDAGQAKKSCMLTGLQSTENQVHVGINAVIKAVG